MTSERQGGVSTYVRALRRHLPGEGVEIVDVGDYDVMLHVGPHNYDGIYGCDRKSVIVVHDLIPELLHHEERVREERKRALRHAEAVLSVSEWTKQDSPTISTETMPRLLWRRRSRNNR